MLNFILTNMRARRDQEGDFNALIGACQVGERALIAMLEKYGEEQVDACIDMLLDMAESRCAADRGCARRHLRRHGDSGRRGPRLRRFRDQGRVTIKGDTCHIAISSPPQIPYFINSYEGNSHSGVYLGLMMFAQLPPPYTRGSTVA